MLDENLPTFLLRPSADKQPHHGTYLLALGSSTPEPYYSVHRPDPKLPASHNCYSIALLDPFTSDIVYAEILLRPEWTHPTLSQDEIRRNGGIPPPPQPIQPTEFTIQLYNPEQQVRVVTKQSSWSGSQSFEFELPVQTFRVPSGSTLDRSQNDPHIDATTPKLSFRWKRDSKLSKDMTLYFRTGKVGPDGKKWKSKEPDITIALFQHFKEVTMYEPNFTRVDLEDYKGMELVILLSAIAVRDLFFWKFEESCNITTYAAAAASAAAAGAAQRPAHGIAGKDHTDFAPPRLNGVLASTGQPSPLNGPRPPPADPMTQWQIDAETTRLKKQQDQERKRREKQEKEERERLRKMVEAEERERRRREEEVNKETERLRRMYGNQQQPHVHFAPQPQVQTFQPSSQLRPNPLQQPHGRRQSVPPQGQSGGFWNRPIFGHGGSQPVYASGALLQPPQPQPSQHQPPPRPGSARPPAPSPSPKPNFYQQPLAAVSTLGNLFSGFRHNDGGRLNRKRSSLF